MSERTPVCRDGGRLDQVLLSHLDSAYNLARWLVRNGNDAEDVVQEAYVRAFRYAGGFRGGDARAWLLTIVRNTAYRWLRKTHAHEPPAQFDEQIHPNDVEPPNPEQLLLQQADARLVEKALGQLPGRFREILILRELEDLSYKQIAEVMEMPIGTVMSTLSRARNQFRRVAGGLLDPRFASEPGPSVVETAECVGAGASN